VFNVKILCTGTSGFFGTAFCEYLHQKYDIVGLDWLPPKEKFPRVKYYQMNILYLDHLRKIFEKERPEKVIHLAAQSHTAKGFSDPIGTYRINVIGTINLLEVVREIDVQQFIYVSSDIVYGKADKYPCKENQSLKPFGPYAASKAACDVLVQNFPEIKWAIARPSMSFGPRGNPREQLVAKFLWNIIHNKPLRFPADKDIVHPTRDINYIENIIHGLELIIEKDAYGIYNLGSGKETSILELAEKIIEVTGKGKIIFDPNFHYRPEEIGMRTWLDITKAKDELGYQPRVSLEEGLEITYNWMCKHLNYWNIHV